MKKRRERSNRSLKKRLEGELVYDGWVQVAVAPNEMVAGMLESILRSEGIPSIQKKLTLDYVAGVAGMRGILVEPDREKEARELLEQVKPDEGSDDE